MKHTLFENTKRYITTTEFDAEKIVQIFPNRTISIQSLSDECILASSQLLCNYEFVYYSQYI